MACRRLRDKGNDRNDGQYEAINAFILHLQEDKRNGYVEAEKSRVSQTLEFRTKHYGIRDDVKVVTDVPCAAGSRKVYRLSP